MIILHSNTLKIIQRSVEVLFYLIEQTISTMTLNSIEDTSICLREIGIADIMYVIVTASATVFTDTKSTVRVRLCRQNTLFRSLDFLSFIMLNTSRDQHDT